MTSRTPNSATPMTAPRSRPAPPWPALCRHAAGRNESEALARPVHRQLVSTELRMPPVIAVGFLSWGLANRPAAGPGPVEQVPPVGYVQARP